MAYTDIFVLGDLVLKERNSIEGFRVSIDGKHYDISRDDLMLIKQDFKPSIQRSTSAKSYYLVPEGNLLVHDNPQDNKKEYVYADYAVLSGYTKMKSTDTDLKRLYNEWNKKAFGGHLPTLVDVQWSNSIVAKAGDCTTYARGNVPFRIRLSVSYFNLNPNDILDTLVHEMIHVYHPKENHDALFIREMNRLNREFGLNIGVYCDGAMDYKYIYDCVSCGQHYKRFKRINVQTNVCGKCNGKLFLAQDFS